MNVSCDLKLLSWHVSRVVMGLKLPLSGTLLAVHLRGKRDRIPPRIGLMQWGGQRPSLIVYRYAHCKNTRMLEDMMTNSVSNEVKSSKLGAVTQGR